MNKILGIIWARPWTAGLALTAVIASVVGMSRIEIRHGKDPQPHWLSLDGLMTGARTLDLMAIQKALPPRIRTANQILIIADTCTCEHCTYFPPLRNTTDLPGILVTDATRAEDRPSYNLSIVDPKSIPLTTEMKAAGVAGLLIDFNNRTVVVARGPFNSWSEWLATLHGNESMYKVNL